MKAETELNILCELVDKEPLIQTQIAENLNMTYSHIVKIIQKLERVGLIETEAKNRVRICRISKYAYSMPNFRKKVKMAQKVHKMLPIQPKQYYLWGENSTNNNRRGYKMKVVIKNVKSDGAGNYIPYNDVFSTSQKIAIMASGRSIPEEVSFSVDAEKIGILNDFDIVDNEAYASPMDFISVVDNDTLLLHQGVGVKEMREDIYFNYRFLGDEILADFALGKIQIGNYINSYFDLFAKIIDSNAKLRAIKKTKEKEKELEKKKAQEDFKSNIEILKKKASELGLKIVDESHDISSVWIDIGFGTEVIRARNEDDVKDAFFLYARRETTRCEAKQKEQEEIDKKKAWIAAHSSEHFQAAFDAGYQAQKAFEREECEFAMSILGDGYEWDIDLDVDTNTMSYPSMDALKEEARLKEIEAIESVKVVWLPYGLSALKEIDEEDDYEDEDEEQTEAVVVEVKGVRGRFFKTF